MDYVKHFSTVATPQSEPIPGSAQVPNSAGGYSFAVDDWKRLDRFLILGAEGGSYYVSEHKLTVENAQAVLRCIKSDGARTVKHIVEVSEARRAPKNDAAIFALAMASGLGDAATKHAALDAMPRVARTGTHLFAFIEAVQGFRGWGRGLRRAVGRWYTDMDADRLAYQLAKYRQRNGWTHRDALRLASPKPRGASHVALFRWACAPDNMGERVVERAVKKDAPKVAKTYAAVDADALPKTIRAFVAVQAAKTADEVVRVVSENPSLAWEMVPSEFLGEARVWDALLPHMPMEAMVRNLARMTANGLIAPLSKAAKHVADRLRDEAIVRESKIHPIAALKAMLTYASGHGDKGKLAWDPVPQVVDALDAAFYHAFGNVASTGKRWVLALDVSGSMNGGVVAGVAGLTPRVASAAMAMVTARVEPNHAIVAFTSGGWSDGRVGQYARSHGIGNGITPIAVSPRQRLDDVVRTVSSLPMGGTDCALPMLWASANGIEADAFVVLTDSETWAGSVHPTQALKAYRDKTGIPAKLIVCGMVANEFTIADPEDAGMLDVVGFDTATPQVVADFVRE